ncbi:MAG: hypothetical protein JW763_01945 [candidate division Zixibacteria bacterium]|nr:hypothetical protein [candidate division Zixibacteria bacterium]
MISDAASSEIINKYIQVSGGENLNAVQSVYHIGTLVRGQTGNVPLEVYAKAPDKWRYNQTFAWGDQIACGFDGISAWQADTGGVSDLHPRQRFDFQLLFTIATPLKLDELFSEIRVKNGETFVDSNIDVLIADSPEGFVTELAFDRKTGVLVRAGDMYFEDYRETGDILLPYRIIFGTADGEKANLVMQFSMIVLNGSVDDSLFERPICNLELKAPPLHKNRITVDIDSAALTPLLGVYRHPADSSLTLTVSLQGNHLMIGRTGSGQKIELKPESVTDFYIKFPDQEFHFLRDSSGNATHLIYGPDSTRMGAKIQ